MAEKIQAGDGKGDVKRAQSKRARNIKVKIIERQGQTVLVEHDRGAGPHRVFVPADKLEGNDIGEDVLNAGIPYGEDWTTWVDKEHGEAFAAQLCATQIWTKDDLLARSHEVRAALQRIYVNPKLTEMLRRATGG
jgi:hypothetical protein